MAWSAAIALIPTIIESIGKVKSEIEKLSKRKITPENVKTQNSRLSEAIGTLRNSLMNIGISLRDYEEIYTLALQEETIADALKNQFSISKRGKQGTKGPSSTRFTELQKLDRALRGMVDASKDEIEKDDLNKLNPMLSNIKTRLDSAEAFLSAKPKNLTAAYNDIKQICDELGNISSLLKGRFKTMSKKLIGFQSSPSKP